ncbi:DUF2252 domain-containing protein [Bosea sp. F3-2]|uniref:DUF2252 domain-containing protein n=1 Tax=Bosea sp. F3-2 TaxID=2599640 RepID=UPI0011EBDC80|nr:DUF2252 domain-containing protein [Bosea sp. F3-2]QEL24926.1 DUF2252 domain-containing protein [Bosea sp. F3-2]
MARQTKPLLLSRAERYAAGKALRSKVPRESHAQWSLRAGSEAVSILAESDGSRIPELLPIRYQRMMQNPFAFLRGAAAVMAADLAGLPSAGLGVQACGDCHLMNFGVFATPEENVHFDINDFDETLPGIDFTVDLKRLAASVAVAALNAGFSGKAARLTVAATVEAYRRRLRRLAKLAPIEAWQARTELGQELERLDDPALRRHVHGLLAKARSNPQQDDNFPHLEATTDGSWRIEDRPPLIYHLAEERDGTRALQAHKVFHRYRETLPPERLVLVARYELRDLAFKVVGVGSVGTFCVVGLFMTADDEPLFLQVKEAQVSVLTRLKGGGPVPSHQGQRVVEGQRMLQAASDVFLGWADDDASGRQFYVRQLKNRRLGSIAEVVEGQALTAYAELCGRTLARAHVRSGDAAAIAGYMGGSEIFDEAVTSFAMAYATQSTQDHAALVAARDPGKTVEEPTVKAGAKASGAGGADPATRRVTRASRRR